MNTEADNGTPEQLAELVSAGAQKEGTITAEELAKKIIERRNSAWEKVLDTVRGAVRKAKNVGEDVDVPLPAAPSGTYIKQALNRYGLYAMPKHHGKIKPHWSPFANAVKSLSIQLFEQEVVLFQQAKVKAALEAGTKAKDVSAAEEEMILHKCYKLAFRYLKNQRNEKRTSRRKRQQSSRRINLGLSVPNRDRQAHAEA